MKAVFDLYLRVWQKTYWLCCWPWKPAKQVPESENWGIQQCYSITGGPSSSCEKIILHNNSHGWIVRVCMRMFTTALRNKTIRQILNENNSPYFHSVSLVIWPFTLMKSTHYIRKAQAWTLHFRTPNPRSEKSQCKTVSLKRSYMSRSFATHLLYLAWPRCFQNRVSTLIFLTDW